jgi:hypothetical protein
MYGPCKNPICNLYVRPVHATIKAGSDNWQHIVADDFEMYGNYTAWDGKVDFILFQATAQGIPNSGLLRIANFHDLQATSVPPSMSLVPSSSPTTLTVEDVAYIVSYAGSVRTVLKSPFQIDATGEVLPMDGSVEYELCQVDEVEGSLSDSPKGLGFIVDNNCEAIRGGNPSVSLTSACWSSFRKTAHFTLYVFVSSRLIWILATSTPQIFTFLTYLIPVSPPLKPSMWAKHTEAISYSPQQLKTKYVTLFLRLMTMITAVQMTRTPTQSPTGLTQMLQSLPCCPVDLMLCMILELFSMRTPSNHP